MSYRSSRTPADADALRNAPYWRACGSKWACTICPDTQNKEWVLSHAIRHHNQQKHKDNVQSALAAAREIQQLSSAPPISSSFPAGQCEDPGLNALRFLSDRFHERAMSTLPETLAPDEHMRDSEDFAHWASAYEEGPSAEQQHLASLLAEQLGRMWGDPDVDGLLSDDDDDERDAPDAQSESEDLDGQPSVRNRESTQDEPWFPYGNAQACSWNVLRYLRRAALSRQQLELARWHAGFNGARDLPTERQMQRIDKQLQDACGIPTISYLGAMGNRFSVNSLADMLAQELANPRVRPHLHDLPEDVGSGPRSEAWQFQQWMEQLPADLDTPMVRLGGAENFQDFYVFEPALLHPRATVPICMPYRWFTRAGSVFARAWKLVPVSRLLEDGSVHLGWHVHEHETVDIPAADFMTSFPALQVSYETHGIPNPCQIGVWYIVSGSFTSLEAVVSGDLKPWLRTKPQLGNRWRALAAGKKVRAIPFWLYCDDTSGNQSKKWNKHNSFLFALSGLPREQAQLEYNIHFLTTSNIAATTEMLDAVVDQIEDAQDSGIWAYDCEEKDIVLLIPSALALLGDNPMQSEFACHIGLRGRHFCRICWVQGKAPDAGSDELPAQAERGDASGNESAASASGGAAAKRKRPQETMASMLKRIQDFVKIGRPRQKSETIANIAQMQEAAAQPVNAQKNYKELKTQFGTKDTFLEFFVDKLFRAIKGKRAGSARTAAADACKSTFPPELTSPIWRLQGLDPHKDTPVEVLHVVLLGIIKYFWRDVVNNQCKSPEARAELIARLNSFDTSGLGIPPLRGETLVQYAGSLVGRDFRSVVQAAPFVLHGIVDDRCYRTWTALSNLVPLIWQPVIEDLEDYLVRLTVAISNLLASTASWTPQWFNKPKFHILLHLPDHIRRFGPAILFATEGFESFNAVIRSKSVHSNRQAPSRDIAVAFAHGDRVRHLLSGGFFRWQDPVLPAGDRPAPREIDLRAPKASRPRTYTAVQPDPRTFVCAGHGVTSLPLLNEIVAKHLGLSPLLRKPVVPRTVYAGPATCVLSETVTSERCPPQSLGLDARVAVRQCKQLELHTGDSCIRGQWVLLKPAPSPQLGRVEELLEVQSASATLRRRIVLVHTCPRPSHLSPVYRMPRIPGRSHWIAADLDDILCTVNVQHDCATHRCSATGRRTMVQERHETQNLVAIVAHSCDEDWILNTGQMRDARYLQRLNMHITSLDLSAAVLAGVRAEVDKRKAAAATPTSGSATASTSSATTTRQQAVYARAVADPQYAAPAQPTEAHHGHGVHTPAPLRQFMLPATAGPWPGPHGQLSHQVRSPAPQTLLPPSAPAATSGTLRHTESIQQWQPMHGGGMIEHAADRGGLWHAPDQNEEN